MESPLEYSRKYAQHTLQHTLLRCPSDKVMAAIENIDDLELSHRRIT